MRYKSIFLGLFLLSYFFNAQAAEISLKSEVVKATVYNRGATLVKKGKCLADKGSHFLIFEEIPADVDENSLRATGEGDFTIVNLTKKINHLATPSFNKKRNIIHDSLVFINRKINYNEAQLKVYKHEENMVLANNKAGSEKSLFSVDDIEDLGDFYRKRLMEIATRVIEVEELNTNLKQTKGRLEAQLREIDNNKKKYQTEVWVEVIVNSRGNISLELSFFVNNAGWYPYYEVYASEQDATVSFVSNARVYQNTGFKWQNVAMALSTANPVRNNNLPVLFPWRLDFLKVEAMPGRTAYNMAAKVESMSLNAGAPMASDMAEKVVLSEQWIDKLFEIELPYSVEGDGKTQKVLLQKSATAADFSYSAVPKRSKDVFLTASISDWEKLQLLEAEASIYLNNNFVGKTNINPRIITDKLQIALGVDPSVSIQRTLADKFTQTRNIGSSKEETKGYEIAIKNNKSRKVILEILDQIPVSSQKDIQVKLIESSQGIFDEQSGFVKWREELLPGATKKLVLTYSVKYPKDQKINH